MMKYVFDYFDGQTSHADEYGVILDDVQDVAAHAITLVRKSLLENLSEIENRLLSVTVHSEEGVRVYYAQVSIIASFSTRENGVDRVEASSRNGVTD